MGGVSKAFQGGTMKKLKNGKNISKVESNRQGELSTPKYGKTVKNKKP